MNIKWMKLQVVLTVSELRQPFSYLQTQIYQECFLSIMIFTVRIYLWDALFLALPSHSYSSDTFELM